MDVDMDIEFDLDPEIARLHAESAALNALPSAMEADTDNNVTDADAMVEDGEVHPSDAVANKIHITGLETLTTPDIERFAHDNNQSEDHRDSVKIEWVNDHSANIVYPTDAAAAAALKAFSAVPTEDPLESRRAHGLLTNPDVELYVRQAVVTDVKIHGAAAHSKFYLRNPQFDPDLQSRSRGRGRGGSRGRGGGRFEYRRHGGGRDDEEADRARRRSSGTEKGFSVDLYDDIKPESAPTAPRNGRRGSNYSGEDLITGRRGGRNTERRSVDRGDGRLRDRSASPARDGAGRDGDGRYGFGADPPPRAPSRRRTPPLRVHLRPDNRGASKAIKVDLFANRRPASALQNGDERVSKAPIELFPNHKTDLFPAKIMEKRQKEFRAADITSAIARQRPRYTADRNGGDLITHNSSQHGRLTDEYGEGMSFSIKGAGSGGSSNEFTILGASSSKARDEVRGGGNDLFDNRSGQSGQRLSRS